MAVTTQLNTGTTPLIVSEGGTGVATNTTAYAPLAAGTTATGAQQVCSTGLSTSGFVLTSTGASSLPTFQAVAAPTGTPILLKVPMTLAQFLGMKVTPFQIIAAQGAHTLILVQSVAIEFVMAGAAFTSGGDAGLQYGSTATLGGVKICTIGEATIAGPTANFTVYVPPGYIDTVASTKFVVFTGSTCINTAVYISNLTAAYTGGAGATVNVNVVYSVITTTG